MSRAENLALQATRLCYQVNGKTQLDGLSLEVPRGAIWGLVGPRGSGKSTALRVLATLLEPTSGQLLIDGRDALATPEQVRSRIGYAAPAWRTRSLLTAREFLEYFAAIYRLPESPRAAVDTILALTQLEHVADTQLRFLAPDELQQLQHARSLLHDPELLLLDEPAQQLNAAQRKVFRDLLLDLQTLGKSVLISSATRNEFTDVCDRVVVLHAGRIFTRAPLDQPTLFKNSDFEIPGVSADAGRTAGGALVPSAVLRWLTLETLKHEPSLYEQLMAAPAVQHVEVRGTIARVGYVGDDTWVANTVRALSLGGVALVSVAPERTTLEQTLRQLAEGTVDD